MIMGLALLVLIGILFAKRAQFISGDDFHPPRFLRLFGIYGTLMVVAGGTGQTLWGSVVIVPIGHRGVVFNKIQGLKSLELNEGFNLITPFIETVHLMDVRIQRDDTASTGASKDLQDVKTNVALNIRPQSEFVAEIYQRVGPDYQGRIVSPSVAEAVKSITAKYTAEELITRREEVKGQILEQLRASLKKENIDLVEMYITDFSFSEGFSRAIESKQIAEQQALKAKRDLDRVKIEADQKIAQARAEAESLKMQKEAITPNLIQLRGIEVQSKAIDKWNGVLPNFLMSGGIPFLNMDVEQLKGEAK